MLRSLVRLRMRPRSFAFASLNCARTIHLNPQAIDTGPIRVNVAPCARVRDALRRHTRSRNDASFREFHATCSTCAVRILLMISPVDAPAAVAPRAK
jgi:hypothetical protein